ncbi:(2E,6E)-farnesyl diphosphate synthase [Oceanimonas doudoroffii]|uniref:(2E,6E)-farnesyl diphosphate synthase n=1 Tax=Oceanimonas doudoroffii TaxID=84158 RepID=A0A233RBN9_9GAMM|nr:(2E,6E)-farnesyl diphosphate synthase [Oceanimonas doudoroffii]OXY80807.1 (2E,6E)-farnesyl diphosphate synthase [Oceanimonas doudoroffii]
MIAQWQQQYGERINAALRRALDRLDDLAPGLRDAMEYGLLQGGKRVRPMLVYATAGLHTDSDQQAADAAAAAIECIHAYSLIHDDLPAMDNDDLRRGKPTVHRAFDEATAILAGDALQTLAFELVSQSGDDLPAERRLRLVQELATASGYGGMCGGQALDIYHEGKPVERATLETIHRHKTGALIRAAVRMGALCSPAMQETELAALSRYAEAIGLAFQVQDDILDITADTATLGKTQGKDLAQQKSTYPALLGLDGARALAASLHRDALAALAGLPGNTETLEAFAHYIVQREY